MSSSPSTSHPRCTQHFVQSASVPIGGETINSWKETSLVESRLKKSREKFTWFVVFHGLCDSMLPSSSFTLLLPLYFSCLHLHWKGSKDQNISKANGLDTRAPGFEVHRTQVHKPLMGSGTSQHQAGMQKIDRQDRGLWRTQWYMHTALAFLCLHRHHASAGKLKVPMPSEMLV